MRSRKPLILFGIFIGALATVPRAWTQDNQSSQPSLADAARRAREQQKSEPKSAKVYTDDDLANLKGQISIVGSEAPAPAGNTADAAKPGAKPEVKDKAYWRKRFADARRALADDQREADVIQREYGLKQVQFYSNPNVGLEQQYSRKDLDDTLAELNAKKADVDKDNQALSDLQDELRQSGGEPGWANEPTSNAPSGAESPASDTATPDASQPTPSPSAQQPPTHGAGIVVAPPPDKDAAPEASQPQ